MWRRILILHRPGWLGVGVCELEVLRWRILLDDCKQVNGQKGGQHGTLYLQPACCGFMAVVETALSTLDALYPAGGGREAAECISVKTTKLKFHVTWKALGDAPGC